MLSTQPEWPGVSPSSTRPAEPRSSGSSAPSGTIHRRPCGDCERDHAAAGVALAHEELHALAGSVAQRLEHRTGESASGKRPAAARPSVDEAGPSSNRPSSSRRSRPCSSSATARRWAVARGKPVAACSSPSERTRFATRRERRSPCRVRRRPLRCPYRKNSIPILGGVRPSGRQRQIEHATNRAPCREGLGSPRGARRTRRTRPAVHRSPPRPRGHQPAGVRRAAARPGAGPPPRPHDRHRGPQRPDAPTSTCRSPIRSRPSRSTCCARTPPSSASRNFPMGDPGQGIVHVIGPEQGRTLPGMTIVCGDSHTATHGAFGALAFGIGTSEVEHVLATQTLPQSRPKWMSVTVDGELADGRHRQGRRSSRSSARSAPAAASATSSSTAVRRSGRCRWRAG